MSDYNIAQRRPEYMGQTAEQVITKAKSQLMDSATGMTSILLGLVSPGKMLFSGVAPFLQRLRSVRN